MIKDRLVIPAGTEGLGKDPRSLLPNAWSGWQDSVDFGSLPAIDGSQSPDHGRKGHRKE